jgi:NADH-ubiquinone oxidoreductase chain 2
VGARVASTLDCYPKQMVLSAALDNGYVFLTLITKLTFKLENIVLSSSLTITISILTLIILLFIFMPQE